MDEARRFLRYVIPGLVFIVEVVLLLWGLVPFWAESKVEYLRNDAGIGFAITALLGSGGLGFVFSVVHHSLLWSFNWCELTEPAVHRSLSERLKSWLTGPVDHRGLIDRLRHLKLLRLLDAKTGNALPHDARPDRFEAWAIVAALWHERIVTSKSMSKKITSAEPRTDSLTNLVHSLGAARVAALFAMILAFVITYHVSEYSSEVCEKARFVITIIIAVVILILHQLAFYKSGLAAQRVVEQILTDAMADEAYYGPVQTYIVLKDKKQCGTF